MKKKANKKSDKKVSKNAKEYNILVYVEDCSIKIKKFDTAKEMGKFIDKFNKENPDYANPSSDNWIDYCVTGITGDIHFFTDGITVE